MPLNTKSISKFLENSVPSVPKCSKDKNLSSLGGVEKTLEAFQKRSNLQKKRSATLGEALLSPESSPGGFWDRKAQEAAGWAERWRRALEAGSGEAAWDAKKESAPGSSQGATNEIVDHICRGSSGNRQPEYIR